MKKQIKIFFVDFWEELQPEQNYFTDLLRTKYDVIITKDNPDFIFYSCFGTEFLNYNCTRVFYSGEIFAHPNFDNCDWSFASDYLNHKIDGIERHYRLPVYVYMSGDVSQITRNKPANIQELVAQKTKFCNFVVSNPSCKVRNDFFHKLSKYKKVDSAGRYLRNIQIKSLKNKEEFLKDYKFTIAFENSYYEGYTTEKLFQPLLANSIPIYWGSKLAYKDFNPKSFLNYFDFPSEEALIERIIEIDNDDNLLAQYLAEPAFVDNKLNEFVEPKNVLAQFDLIINTKITPISQKVYSSPIIVRSLKKAKKKWEFIKSGINFTITNFRFSKFKIKYRRIKDKLEQRKEAKLNS